MANASRIGFPRDFKAKQVTEEETEKIRHLKSLLKDAQNIRRQTREKHWRDAENRYMGEQPILNPDDPTADAIVINKTFSTIETVAPFVTGGDIEFIVEPFSDNSNSNNARYISIWLNRLWRTNEFGGEEAIGSAAWDSVVYGDGFLNPTYDIKEQVRRGNNGEPIPLSDKNVVEFSIEVVSPWDVWIDRYARGLTDARWFIRRIVLPRDVVEEDDRFYYKDQITDMVREHGLDTEQQYFDHLMREGEREMVVMFEYWDKDTDEKIIFSESCEYPHQWVNHVRPSLVQLANHRIPGLPYHMSDVEQMKQLQDELNKTRSQMITQRRRGTLKYAYDKNMFDSSAVDALQSNAIGIGIPVDATNMPISEGLQVIQPAPIPEHAYNVANVISSDIDEITGINEYLRGSMGDISRTATEASIIEGSSNTKIRAKLKKVERAARQFGQGLLEIAGEVIPTTDFQELRMYLTGEEAQQLLTSSGQDVFDENGDPRDAVLTPAPQLFSGKYEVFVQQGSTELRNPQAKEQRMRNVFTTLVNTYPVLQQAGVTVSLRHALMKWLEAAGITDLNSFLNDPVAMAQGQEAQMQQMLMQQMGQGGQQQAPAMGPANQDMKGLPNLFGAQAPTAPIDESNSGVLPPNGGGLE